MATVSSTPSPAGQVRWWSATVVTPHSSDSASPTRAATPAVAGVTPTDAYACAICGSQSRIGTPRVPGNVRKAVCSRWWWALTRPGVTTHPDTSSVS